MDMDDRGRWYGTATEVGIVADGRLSCTPEAVRSPYICGCSVQRSATKPNQLTTQSPWPEALGASGPRLATVANGHGIMSNFLPSWGDFL